MNRVILTPATLPSSALAELKQWLGITTGYDDDALASLLATALETCEAFTGLLPLECTCEEILPAARDWSSLSTHPVQAITALELVGADGTRTPVPASDYALDLKADGTGRVHLLSLATGRLAVRFTAGLAADWDTLPETLRHGIVRLAAHQHREREGSGASPLPPASVAALWRPWRRMRLA
ncbi:head-tail connector protein [Novosphingobium mangrovi (ex Hu et al. 2023)]|uniref:PhiE125 gp8 family phage protein n=1 Tax=Novosphingobium mangrovi (ex Hu et al. 2023) TaxID=2930094 RepID=A0ABT0AD33_9SPHN|nr:hypothetical protein [Novosphingobium mangrovi (ex Hu et al. 2023)]MCJ1961108.1 hypothetical protein [Novosphingobium mangrovi (ex Hu et al. 2023)]